MKRIHLISLATMVGLASLGACRDRGESSARVKAVKKYEENGVVWGWGDVRLTVPTATTGIFLDRLPEGAPNGQTFKLVGADPRTGSTTDLFYADWHLTLDPPVPVLFVSQYYLQERAGARGTTDVYVKLKKPGRTWPESFAVSVGTADVRDESLARYPVKMVGGLKISTSAAGEQRGAVVFHYADLPRNGGGGGAGGAMPANRIEGEGFNATQREGQTIWSLVAGSQGKLTFVSRSIEAKPEDHPRLCHDQFFAGARTAGNQVNKSCKLTLAPADSITGWLTCALLVRFDNPGSTSEKTCRVIASFLGEDDDSDQLSAVVTSVGAAQ